MQNRDATYSSIFDGYDYTRIALQPLDPELVDYNDASPPSSLELARGIVPGNATHRASTADTDLVAQAAEFADFGSEQYWERERVNIGPPGLPAPPAPVFSPMTRRAPTQSHYYADYTDLPTSEQTYGNTGVLLNLTPEQHEVYPRYTGAAANTHEAYRPSFIADSIAAQDGDVEYDKENTPPGTAGLGITAPQNVQAGIPPTWSGCDLPRRSLASGHDQAASGQPVPRSSSFYPADNESVWQSTQASESHQHLGGLPRASENSYADTSIFDENRLSLVGAQGQPHNDNVITTDGAFEAGPYANTAHRVLFEGQDDQPQDINTKRAERIMSNKIMEDSMMEKLMIGANLGPDDHSQRKEQRKAELAELERMRRENPSAIRAASERVMGRFRGRFPIRPYDPRNSYDRVLQEAQGNSSETRGLLSGSQSPGPGPSNLQYHDSVGTFATTPRGAPPMPGMTVNDAWSPIASPPAVMTARTPTATISSARTGNPDEYELDDLTRSVWNRPAMSSQTGLRSLRLGRSNAASSTTTCPAPPTRPMTDEELAARAPGWTMDPRALTRSAASRRGIDSERPQVTDETPTLLSVEEGRHPELVRLQKKISSKYFIACCVCPVTTVMFGLGCFDRFIGLKTEGRVKEMRKTDKLWMLQVVLPLQLIVAAVTALVVVMIFAAKRAMGA